MTKQVQREAKLDAILVFSGALAGGAFFASARIVPSLKAVAWAERIRHLAVGYPQMIAALLVLCVAAALSRARRSAARLFWFATGALVAMPMADAVVAERVPSDVMDLNGTAAVAGAFAFCCVAVFVGVCCIAAPPGVLRKVESLTWPLADRFHVSPEARTRWRIAGGLLLVTGLLIGFIVARVLLALRSPSH